MAKWPSDKELEEIYRRGSESHDFEFRPDAWEDMEKLLDNEKKKYGLLIRSTVVLGLLALSYLSYDLFFADHVDSPVLIEDRISTEAIAQEQVSSTIELDNQIETADPHTSQDPLQQQTVTTSSINGEKVTAKTTDRARNDIGQLNNLQGLGDRSNNLGNLARSTVDNNAKTQYTTGGPTHGSLNYNSADNRELSSSSPTELTKENNAAASSSQTLITILPFSNDRINNPYSLTSKDYHLYTLPSDEQIDQQPSNSFKRFFIGVSGGVESSWTPNGDFSQLDYNVGLRSSFFVSPRWGLRLGAIYQSDRYVAKKGDYRTSEEFWESRGISTTPEFTNARGNMLEFSLGSSYSFNHRNQNGFSVSADVVNTFMLSEWYDFNFVDEANNFSSSWSSENHSLLSSLNLSSSYRSHLSRNFLLEVGPYLRIPLSGIGHGNMRLSSIGLRMTVGLKQ